MKKTLSLFGLLFSILSVAQVTTTPSGISTNENYVFSRTYLDATTTSNISTKQIQSVTYFDGLGRPKQSVAINASHTGKDLVTIIPYDGFGRQVDSYLPVSMISANGGIQSIDSTGVVSYYNSPQNGTTKDFPIVDIRPFSHKKLENSPLDRIQQQIQVGQDWSAKPVTFEYLAAQATDLVKKYTFTTSWGTDDATAFTVPTSTIYADNTLYKNSVKDEDGNETIEFKNGKGQTILVRKVLSATENADTYYVYNDYDQLTLVISPLASVKATLSQSDLDNLCYQYRYDGKNRLVEKKLPGKGWEYMVYDKADRLILTQDANMRTAGKWLLTKYDKFGRVIYTGITPGGTRFTLQDSIKDLIITEDRTSSGFIKNGLTVEYTNGYFTSISDVLSVNYYDTYPGGTILPLNNEIQGVPILKDHPPAGESRSTQSLPTASFLKNIESNSWTKNYTFYDKKGRPLGNHSYNHLGGYTKSESILDFAGTPQQTFTYHKRKNGDAELKVKETFVYNQYNNALVDHFHEVVGKTPPELLTYNEYNEIGQLIKKQVGNNIQEIHYSYNIRGWMTGINLDLSGNPELGKLFNYKIKYNNPDPITATVVGKFNGNIAEIDWWNNGSAAKRYSYQYDGLNRLLNGIYNDPGATIPTNINSESIEYDLNGNITKLYRNTKHGKFYTPVQIDNLSYIYENGNGNSNRLQNITDATNNTSGYPGGGGTITYDTNGNMTSMPDKGISSINYNFLNLPTRIVQNINTTQYIYRADGVKLQKTYSLVNALGTKTINTEYLDGFQYSTPNTKPIRKALEEQDEATLSAATAGNEEAFLPPEGRPIAPGDPAPVAMVLSFFPTAEGYYDYENFRYIYQYKDHLGNVRVSYVREGRSLKTVDANDYYPFGLNFLKPTDGISQFDPMAIPYNYKYNGKELQETGMYDYGARMYMPDIGRWGVVDALSEGRPNMTPYRYSFNNPVNATDPTGLWEDWYTDKEGDYVYDASLNSSNASTKLSKDDKYLGESAIINVNNTKGDQVGTIDLNKDGGIEVKGDFVNDGHVKTQHINYENGSVQVVDANLASGAKVYGADTFNYSQRYENMDDNSFNDTKFEFNAKAVATNDPTYKPQGLLSGDKTVNRIINSNAGSGIAPYCSQCPSSTAGPGPMSTGDPSAYNGYRIGIGINHFLWHVLFKDNNSKDAKTHNTK